jgi:uncharacterized protein YndB with AHSA1/START domain
MKRSEYRPGPIGEAAVQTDGKQWTLVFVRELRHSPQKVWGALTDPAQLSHWAPFDADRDLGKAKQATLTTAGGNGDEKLEVEIRRADAPTLLEYSWGGDVLRWELEATQAGTRLTLRHTVEGKTWVPRVATGWHMCLDIMDLALGGKPIGRIVAGEARNHGWEQLNDSYAEHLKIENAGWPEHVASTPESEVR